VGPCAAEELLGFETLRSGVCDSGALFTCTLVNELPLGGGGAPYFSTMNSSTLSPSNGR
jgi:hypothetical protein